MSWLPGILTQWWRKKSTAAAPEPEFSTRVWESKAVAAGLVLRHSKQWAETHRVAENQFEIAIYKEAFSSSDFLRLAAGTQKEAVFDKNGWAVFTQADAIQKLRALEEKWRWQGLKQSGYQPPGRNVIAVLPEMTPLLSEPLTLRKP